LRRILLAESLVLCGAGAILGVALARPFVSLVARYAARFSVRALDVTVDPGVLWIGAALAMAAAIVLAYVPRLPSPAAPAGLGLANGSLRLTPSTNRRLRVFATVQIAFSFVMLAAAAMLVTTLVSLQTAKTGFNVRHVLVFDVPTSATGAGMGAPAVAFYDELTARVARLPGVERVAVGSFVPWRDAGLFGPGFHVKADGYTPAAGEEDPRAQFRIVSPGFFAAVGVPIVAGRDFSDDDRAGAATVAIVSESLAQRLFPNGEAVNRRVAWVDPISGKLHPGRIVGVTADADDEHVVAEASPTLYFAVRQLGIGGRLFVRASGDPYGLVPAVTRTVRELASDQAIDRAATLEDVRAQVLSPERLQAFVFSGFAGIALLIAIVGVAGVLAFSVSARTYEIGIRMSLGADAATVRRMVLSEGGLLVGVGLALGAVGAVLLARLVRGLLFGVAPHDPLTLAGVALLMAAIGLGACWLPALRAARIDPGVALRAN
jgi:predicted permease